ncbi:hypothetical protein [Marinicrinis lubricantis]|uniref:Uncharacterized protein n=1 Tax=Marinicrinis lubricantis TaxID=2086470 RepID=A0ABW1IQT2_9BACL
MRYNIIYLSLIIAAIMVGCGKSSTIQHVMEENHIEFSRIIYSKQIASIDKTIAFTKQEIKNLG